MRSIIESRRRPAPIRRLADLNLAPEELRELTRQGFIAREYRGDSGPFFKIRFRVRGRQIVRYLGSDVHTAAAVARELRALQAGRRLARFLGRLRAQARRLLRRAKRRLEPLLRARGFYLHGHTVRRRRHGPKPLPAIANVPTHEGGKIHDRTQPGKHMLPGSELAAGATAPPQCGHAADLRLPPPGAGLPQHRGAEQLADAAGSPCCGGDRPGPRGLPGRLGGSRHGAARDSWLPAAQPPGRSLCQVGVSPAVRRRCHTDLRPERWVARAPRADHGPGELRLLNEGLVEGRWFRGHQAPHDGVCRGPPQRGEDRGHGEREKIKI